MNLPLALMTTSRWYREDEGVAVRWTETPDIKWSLVDWVLWQPGLGLLASMAGPWVLLPHVGPTCSYMVYAGLHYLTQNVDVAIGVQLEASGKKWGGMMSPSLLMTQKTILYLSLETLSAWLWSHLWMKQQAICCSESWSSGICSFFLQKTNHSMSGSSVFQLVDQLLGVLQSLFLPQLWQKLSLSHLIWNIVDVLMHHQTDGHFIHTFLPCNSTHRIAGLLSMISWTSATNSSVLMVSDHQSCVLLSDVAS